MVKVLGKATWAAPALLAVGVLAFGGPALVYADPTVLSDGVAGIEVNYDDVMGLSLDISTDEAAFDAREAILLVGPEARDDTLSSDPAYAFLGANAGAPVWVLPQYPNPDLVFLGTDTTGIDRGTFDTYLEPDLNFTGEWVKVTLQAVRGPGTFSVWFNNFGAPPNVRMTTSHVLTDHDAIFTLTNSEDRYNFGFSAPGTYEIDLQVSAMLNGALIQSEVTTYTFQVVDQ